MAPVGVFFAGAGLAVMFFNVGNTVAGGGTKFYAGESATWVPSYLAVPLCVAFCAVFVVFGVSLALQGLVAKIETDDAGIWRTNCLGKESFRARWDEILSVLRDSKGECPMTRVVTNRGSLRFPNNHSFAAEILRDIHEHTGLDPSETVAGKD